MPRFKLKFWHIAVLFGIILFFSTFYFGYYYLLNKTPLVIADVMHTVKKVTKPADYTPNFVFNITPDQGQFQKPMGVAVDFYGRIFVTDVADATVKVFNANGKKVGTLGGRGENPGQFVYPNCITVDNQDRILVGDFKKGSIEIFNRKGKYQTTWDKNSLGTDISPLALAVDDKDNVYVADRSGKVVIISSKGKVLHQFGKPGALKGYLSYPNGIAVAKNGDIYVSDSGNKRIQIFTATGKFKKVLAPPQFDVAYPRGIALDGHGRLFVADLFRHKVAIFNKRLQKTFELGGRGLLEGEFNFPNDVEISGNKVYVVDRANKRIAIFMF